VAGTLPVEKLGDLFSRFAGRDRRLDKASHPRNITQALVMADRPAQGILGCTPTESFDSDNGVFGVFSPRHGHPLDDDRILHRKLVLKVNLVHAFRIIGVAGYIDANPSYGALP
jgi:hypothetical protein